MRLLLIAFIGLSTVMVSCKKHNLKEPDIRLHIAGQENSVLSVKVQAWSNDRNSLTRVDLITSGAMLDYQERYINGSKEVSEEFEINPINAEAGYEIMAVVYTEDGRSFDSGWVTYGQGKPVVGLRGPALGYVFYVDSLENGYEVFLPPNEYSFFYESWGCEASLINGLSENVGSGQQNTNQILSQCFGSGAVDYCNSFSNNGYTDWYLPSIGDLEKINENLFNGNHILKVNQHYISSSQYSANTCLAFFMGESSSGVAQWQKNVKGIVLPVRTF